MEEGQEKTAEEVAQAHERAAEVEERAAALKTGRGKRGTYLSDRAEHQRRLARQARTEANYLITVAKEAVIEALVRLHGEVTDDDLFEADAALEAAHEVITETMEHRGLL